MYYIFFFRMFYLSTLLSTLSSLFCSTLYLPLSYISSYYLMIHTDYGLDGPGSNLMWGRDFPPVQTGPGAQPSLLYNVYRVFPGGKVRQDKRLLFRYTVTTFRSSSLTCTALTLWLLLSGTQVSSTTMYTKIHHIYIANLQTNSDVLLTAHLSIISVINQPNAQNLFL
jgi:hypothetical protein